MSIKIENNFKPLEVSKKLKSAIALYGDTASKKLERDAKINAKWTDRTGNARNSIQGNFKWENDNAVIILSGNVYYFVYLELAMEKRWSILKPTVDKNSSEIINGYRKLMR